jgi:hypothetical protein
MAENQSSLFSIGLTYWPRRKGHAWWRAFDRAEARDELAHVAALGCDTVRLCLRWEDFQPGPRRLNSAALNALEQAFDAAQEAGLRVVAALFPVAFGGALQLPAWANGDDPLAELRRAARMVGPAMVVRPAGGPLLLYDGGYHKNEANDLFSDARLLDAQRYLIRELAGYFGSHPALYAWQLGEGLERVHKPVGASAAYEWLAAMVEALREQRADARALGVVSTRALLSPAGPRPEAVAETCDLLGVAADPPDPPLAKGQNHAVYVAYLHALVASLGRRAATVTSLGLPTAPDGRAGWISDSAYGRSLRAYRGDLEQQSGFVADALDRLHRGGATGAWLAAYADYPADLWREPPLDRAIRERTLGLVDADGREKPAAGALRRFAAERRAVAEIAPPLDADPDRYWREPQRLFEELWGDFSAQ